MKKEENKKSWFSPLFTGQILLMVNIGLNIFIKSDTIVQWIREAGIYFTVPALILWILPVLTLRKFGDISPSGSFLATTELVDKGIYGLIRHPQYLGFMFLSIGMGLFYQLDITIGMAALTIVLLLIGIKEEEYMLIDQFGDDYEAYKKSVPAFNLFSGLFRMIKRQNKAHK